MALTVDLYSNYPKNLATLVSPCLSFFGHAKRIERGASQAN